MGADDTAPLEPASLNAESAAHDETPLRSERLARTLARVVMFQFGVLVTVAIVGAYYIVHGIHTNRSNLRDFACYIIQGTPDSAAPIVPQYRSKYHCPAFDPTRARDFQPGPAPTVTDTRTVPGPTVRVPVPTTMPGGTVTAPTAVPTTVPGKPGPTVTRRRTVTVTAHPTVCAGKICITLPLAK